MQKKIIRQGGLKEELFRLSPNKSPSLISSQKVSGIKDLVTQNLNQTLPAPSQASTAVDSSSKYKQQHESFDLSSTGGSIEKKGKVGVTKQRPPVDPNRTRNQIVLETSTAGPQAGVNVSYDNSFTSIKRDIQKETMDKYGKGAKE